jgi:predicted enzyme related to lactoylglutathione lyase
LRGATVAAIRRIMPPLAVHRLPGAAAHEEIRMQTSHPTRREALATLAVAGVAALAGSARAEEGSAPPSGVATARAAHFGFTKLVVADLEKCAAFYEAAFALVRQTRIDTESAGRKLSEILYQPTAPGAATFVLIHFYDALQPVVGELVLGFNTDDIDAFVARAQAAGGTIDRAPYAIEEMKIKVAFVRDVEGHLIEVVQPAA